VPAACERIRLALQLGAPVGGDVARREGTEAGGDPVVRIGVRRETVDHAAQVPATQVPATQVPAAENTLRILSYLAGRPAPVAASSIARELELPRSTVYHLLTTMAAHGFVLHLREERRWGLGTSAFELAGGYTRQQPLARRGRPLVAALSDRLGESAHLAVMSGGDVLYIVEERAPRRPALVTDVGVRLPAHLTASGRAMLAALPREQVLALYPRRCPTLPQGPPCSTIGAVRLSFRVRNVTGRFPHAMAAETLLMFQSNT
jgi:DNA-binding IclR family transcriptional regulator